MTAKPRVNHHRYWSLFLLIGALLSGAANYSVRVVAHNAAVEERESTAMIQSRSTLLDCIDAETGLRGYLVTGQRTYLQPYFEAGGRITADLATFRAKLPPCDEIPRVEQLTGEVQAEFATQINLVESDGVEAARRRHAEHPTKPLMDEIRVNVAAVRAVEARRLDDARVSLRSNLDTSLNLLNISTFGGLITSLALATSLLRTPGAGED